MHSPSVHEAPSSNTLMFKLHLPALRGKEWRGKSVSSRRGTLPPSSVCRMTHLLRGVLLSVSRGALGFPFDALSHRFPFIRGMRYLELVCPHKIMATHMLLCPSEKRPPIFLGRPSPWPQAGSLPHGEPQALSYTLIPGVLLRNKGRIFCI